jgi:hypothetical protein
MKDCRRILIVAATLLVATAGVARAEQESSSPPQQTSSFWSWLFPSSSTAPKPRPAPTGRVTSAPEPAKQRQSCTLLTCVTLVGVGF